MNNLKTNEKDIVEFTLQCQPGPPRTRGDWRVDHDGTPFLLPSIGGITLNIQVGDPAFGSTKYALVILSLCWITIIDLEEPTDRERSPLVLWFTAIATAPGMDRV